MSILHQIPNSPVSYMGPYFDVTYTSIGQVVSELRTACMQYYAPAGMRPGTTTYIRDVANCILNNLTEQSKTNAAGHSYAITLWPAFVSIIVAIYSDAGPMAYDNIGWTMIHALTCGGIPGYATLVLPHRVSVPEVDVAKRLCETWRDEPPAQKISRLSNLRAGTYTTAIAELVLLFYSTGLWAAFIGLYIMALYRSFQVGTGLPWCYAIIWYCFSAVPAIFSALPRLALNNVDLYEPMPNRPGKPAKTASKTLVAGVATRTSSPQTFSKQKMRHGLQTWCRIAYLQFASRPYRLVVRSPPQTLFLAGYDYLVFLGRIAVFIWGSIVQGTLIFVPTPIDFGLLILLIFATATPRMIAPKYLRNSRRGADLVVFVESPI